MNSFELIRFEDLNDKEKKDLEYFTKASPVKEALDELKNRMGRTKFYTDIPTDGELIFEIQKVLKIFLDFQKRAIEFALTASELKERIGVVKN